MPEIAVLDTGSGFVQAQLERAAVSRGLASIDLYRMHETDLTRYAGLIVPGSADQEHLYRERRIVRSFLDSGRVLVFTGHLFRDWLPGAAHFVPKGVDAAHRIAKGIHTSDAYSVRVVTPHPVFDGVRPEDLTFNRGVRGFFARGHHPPPEGAQVLLALESGEPTTYVDRVSTGGTLLVHSGNDLLGYAPGFVAANSTAGRIGPQLLRWVRDEFASLQEARSRR